jgi:hypothetical protein
MDRQSLNLHFNEMRTGLFLLRHLLGKDAKAEEIFDEYINHNEFELALHTICWSLLDRKNLVLGEDEIEAIAVLHEKMQIQDECCANLRQNRGV